MLWCLLYTKKNQHNFCFYFSTEVYVKNFAGHLLTSIQTFEEVMKTVMSFKTLHFLCS